MHPDDAATIIGHSASRRLFLRKENGEIEHSAASSALVRVPGLANSADVVLNSMWKAAPLVVETMDKWPGSQEPAQTAYNIAYRTDLSYFKDLAIDGFKAKKFADAMSWLQSGPELSHDYVLKYDWSQHAKGTVVDVGGSQGDVAFKIVEHFLDIEVIVQDRPEIIALAQQKAHKNVEFQEHDFFTSQPVHGADVYFFRWIFHDWPAKYCIQVLQALVPALKPGARILLMETIVPEPGVCTPYQERPLRNYDLIMNMLFAAKERSLSDWKKLIGDADERGRFELVDVLQPEGSQLGFLVIDWQG